MVVRRGGLLSGRGGKQLDICRRQANIGCRLNSSFDQLKVRKTEILKTFLCRLINFYSYDKVKTAVVFSKIRSGHFVVILTIINFMFTN